MFESFESHKQSNQMIILHLFVLFVITTTLVLLAHLLNSFSERGKAQSLKKSEK